MNKEKKRISYVYICFAYISNPLEDSGTTASAFDGFDRLMASIPYAINRMALANCFSNHEVEDNLKPQKCSLAAGIIKGKLRKIELWPRLSGSYDIWVINELCGDMEYVRVIKTINNKRNVSHDCSLNSSLDGGVRSIGTTAR